jgi:hypothetical protein
LHGLDKSQKELDRPQFVTAHATQKEFDNYKTRRRENRGLPKNPNFLETTRMILKATQIRKKETTTQTTKFFFITNTNATKFTRFTTCPGAVLVHKLSYS